MKPSAIGSLSTWAPSISLLHYQGGDCLDEKRCCFLADIFMVAINLEYKRLNVFFFFFFDRCFAAAASCSAHSVWESTWESDMVNNLLFKAVAIRALISKLPHGNLKSTGDRLCNQSWVCGQTTWAGSVQLLGDQATRRIQALQGGDSGVGCPPRWAQGQCTCGDWGKAEMSHNSSWRPRQQKKGSV